MRGKANASLKVFHDAGISGVHQTLEHPFENAKGVQSNANVGARIQRHGDEAIGTKRDIHSIQQNPPRSLLKSNLTGLDAANLFRRRLFDFKRAEGFVDGGVQPVLPLGRISRRRDANQPHHGLQRVMGDFISLDRSLAVFDVGSIDSEISNFQNAELFVGNHWR